MQQGFKHEETSDFLAKCAQKVAELLAKLLQYGQFGNH